MRRCTSFVAFVLLIAALGSASAQPVDRPIFVGIAEGPLAAQPAARQLLAKVKESGRIGVIIGLSISMADEDQLTPAARSLQGRRLNQAQDALVRRTGISWRAGIKKYEIIPYLAAQVTRSELVRLLGDPKVTSIAEDFTLEPLLTRSTEITGSSDLWLQGITGQGQVIAILDSGVDSTHPMLAGKIVSEACYSTTNQLGYESLCPGGALKSVKPGSGANCPLNIFPCFHGTHVASIAAGRSSRFSGVANGAEIISIKVVSKGDDASDCGSLPVPCAIPIFSDVIRGLERVYRLRAQFSIAAVNLSAGSLVYEGTCDQNNPALTDIVGRLRKAGIVTVVAAGNQGEINKLLFPACVSIVIAVGATPDSDDQVAGFSNYSAFLKLLAPGQNITAAVPPGSVLPPGTQCTGKYCTITGTSQAAPHVAGAFALLKQAFPSAKLPKMLSALFCTGKRLARGGMYRPRINVLSAKAEVGAADPVERFDFNAASELDSWRQDLGTWKVVGGSLKVGSWPSSGTLEGEWVMASHDYCSSSFIAKASIDPIAPTSTPNRIVGLLLASDISIDGPTVSATGFYVGYHNTQVFVHRLENYPLKAGVQVGGGNPRPCLLASGANPFIEHVLWASVERDGVYNFFYDLQHVCEIDGRLLPPITKVAVIALRPAGEAGHEFAVDWIRIRPK